MTQLSSLVIATALTLGGAVAVAQDQPVEFTQLTDHPYLLTTDQGS